MSKLRLIFGLCLILLTFSSCRPKGVISRNEMTDVLYDLHLTEAMTSGMDEPVPDGWRAGLSADYFRDLAFQSVLRKHHISEETFYASVSYYSKHLGIYTKIYAKVEERLRLFVTDIDDWEYNTPSIEEFLSHLKLDTLEVQAFYVDLLYKPDTIPVKRLYLTPDSLPSFSEWKARQWLHEIKVDTVAFTMLKDSSGTFVTDSLAFVGKTNKADTVPNTRIVEHKDASGKIKMEVVAIEARKAQPNRFRDSENSDAIRKRFKDRINEHDPSRQ